MSSQSIFTHCVGDSSSLEHDLPHYPDIAPMLVVIAAVLWSALGSLNLLRAQTHEPDLCIIHDFLLLEPCQLVLEVLECLCNSK